MVLIMGKKCGELNFLISEALGNLALEKGELRKQE
jgi:hypothetical protein